MRIVCWQTILMKYHALCFIFEKSSKIWNCRLLQIVGGALIMNTIPRWDIEGWLYKCKFVSFDIQIREIFNDISAITL